MKLKRSAQLILRHAGRLVVIGTLVLSLTWVSSVQAGTPTPPYRRLNNRSLNIDSTNPGATTTYRFQWDYPTGGITVGSVEFMFCTDPFFVDPCDPPPGADFSGAVLTAQTGTTGFSIDNQSTDYILMTRPPSVVTPGPSTYTLSNVVNPSDVETIYIRLWSYPTNDGTGPQNGVASVLNSTVMPIGINGVVPPILDFCVGLTAPENCRDVTPNRSYSLDFSSLGNFIDYGTFTSAATKYATTEFAASTNATNGYVVTANGNTLTSGNKVIQALTVPTASIPGTEQFGINLRANSDPATGEDITGTGIGAISAAYDNPDLFKFETGDTVASTTAGSLYNHYTVSYIINVPDDQPAGIYTTTITFICSGAF